MPVPAVARAEPSSAPARDAGARERVGPRLLALGYDLDTVFREPRYEWRRVQGLNWQPSATGLPALPPEPAAGRGGCPAGMLPVDGELLLDADGREDTDGVQLAQDEACTKWRTDDRSVNGLCDRFDRDRWSAIRATLPRKHYRFCIDRYEFPNAYGEFPLVVVTYAEAQRYCEKRKARLCTESEWTLACEGNDGLPYPYGYERDETACTIGILGPGPDKDTFRPRTTATTAKGIDRSWRGTRSGEARRCESPFGVMDLTGNVDEWTQSVRKYGYRMILKGGHWGPARQRCRPQTRGHGPAYVRYDQGFRCCRDSP